MAGRDLKGLVIGMDPTWPRTHTRHEAYRFSNGRTVIETIRPGKPYDWTKDMDLESDEEESP